MEPIIPPKLYTSHGHWSLHYSTGRDSLWGSTVSSTMSQWHGRLPISDRLSLGTNRDTHHSQPGPHTVVIPFKASQLPTLYFQCWSYRVRMGEWIKVSQGNPLSWSHLFTLAVGCHQYSQFTPTTPEHTERDRGSFPFQAQTHATC